MATFKINEDTRRELERFKYHMRKQEYTETTITGYCTYLSRFLRKTRLPEINSLEEAIVAFLKIEREAHPQTFKECRASLKLYFKMVTGDNFEEKPEPISVPVITDRLQRFRTYSLEVKCLEKDTIASEISHVRGFLEYTLSRSPQGFVNGLTAQDIRSYVVERFAELSDSSKGRYITSIRNFFRCQAFYGELVHPSIYRLPLSPAVWKKSAFPSIIEVDVFDALHMIPDKTTNTGKRNRCIILCFTELALRCSEVAALTLDDFNWRERYVTIRNTKNNSERVLPLSAKLWSALVEYLTQVRPQTLCRILFVRFSHQCGKAMGCSQIRGVVRRNGVKAGLEEHACGTHILRRTAATKLYNSGNSLKLTADILGHESIDSTTHYAKADVVRLLSVASPWPGGDCDVG